MTGLSLKLYETLFLVRKAEEYIIQYYPEDEMKTPMHMSMGQEAIPVGVCAALGQDGIIFTSYRSHASFLAKTGNVEVFFAELFGRETGTAHGKAGSMHLADFASGHLCSTAIVASGIPIALGAAFVAKQQKTGRMPATFFGDGATDEGSFWESINVACAMHLPMLFVCENNGLAVHTDQATRRGYKKIIPILEKFDCIAVHDDSNDVEKIHELTVDAIRRSQEEMRPAFLEFECYRYLEHVGINTDFHEEYRSEDEYLEYQKKDSLVLQRKHLLKLGHSEDELLFLEQQIEDRIRNSVRMARQAPLPSDALLYTGVFYEKN